jgi:sortase A
VSDLASPTTASGELRLRRRPSSRSHRAVRLLALALIAAGSLALLDAVVTLVWQEPFSWLYARIQQDQLAGALRKVEAQQPTVAEQRALETISDERARIAFLARQQQQQTGNGGPVGRILIPRLGANFVVVAGTDTSDLERGPGLDAETSFPGSDGTTAIAGHRTTFLAPFRHIDELRKGDQIELKMPYALLTYSVLGSRVVAPTDVGAAVANVGYSRLVLSACTPLFSAAKRILVFARLAGERPRGAALALPRGEVARPIGIGWPSRRLPPVLESLDPDQVAPV